MSVFVLRFHFVEMFEDTLNDNKFLGLTKSFKLIEVNSSSLSVCNYLIEMEKSFSAIVLNLTKVTNTLDFCCKRYNHE